MYYPGLAVSKKLTKPRKIEGHIPCVEIGRQRNASIPCYRGAVDVEQDVFFRYDSFLLNLLCSDFSTLCLPVWAAHVGG